MMPNKSGFYFSYYQSPNIVIVPTETPPSSVQPIEKSPDTATNSLSTENLRTEEYVGKLLSETPAIQSGCILENNAVDVPINIENITSYTSKPFDISQSLAPAEVNIICNTLITPTSYMYQSRKNLVVLTGNDEPEAKSEPQNTKLSSNVNENEIIELSIETEAIKVGEDVDYNSLGTAEVSIATYQPGTPVKDKIEPSILSMQQPLPHAEGMEPSMSSIQQPISHFNGIKEPSTLSIQQPLTYFQETIDPSIPSIQEPITNCVDTTATNYYPIDDMTSSTKYTDIERYLEYIDNKYDDPLNYININQSKNDKDLDSKTEQFLKKLQRRKTEKRRCDSSHRHSESRSKLCKYDVKTMVTDKESSNSSKSSRSQEREYERESFDFKYETFRHKTLTETQKNNLSPGALQRYLAYQRFLGKYYSNACSNRHDIQQKESKTSHEENRLKSNKSKTINKIAESKHVEKPSEKNRSETTKKKSNKDGDLDRKQINKELDKPSTRNLKLKKSKETANEKKCDFNQETKVNKKGSNKPLSRIKENNERSKEKLPEKLERKKRKEEITKKLTRYAELKKEREKAKEKLVRSLELKKYKEKSKEKLARYLELQKKKESIDKLIRKMEEKNSTTKLNKKTIKSSTSKFSTKKEKSDMESKSRIKLKADLKKSITLNNSNFADNIIEKESKLEKKCDFDRKEKQIENKRLIMSKGSVIRSSKSETKNVKSILKIANTNEKMNRYNSPSTFHNETDLRTMLSSRRTKSHSHRETNRNENSKPQRENLVITLNQEVIRKSKPEPDLTTNKVKITRRRPPKIKRASKAMVKSKKIKLVINIECPNSDSDDSDESASFLDDFNVDEIVDSLNLCENPINAFNIPKDILNNEIICVNAEPKYDVHLQEKLRKGLISNDLLEECEVKKSKDDERGQSCLVTFKDETENKNDTQPKEENLKDTDVLIENKELETTRALSTNTLIKRCDDDVYEVIDITDDMDTISLEDDLTNLNTGDNEAASKQKIEHETVILVDDDSKDINQTSNTVDKRTNSLVENLSNNCIPKHKIEDEGPEIKTHLVDIPQSSTSVDEKPANFNEAKNMPVQYSAHEHQSSMGMKTKLFDKTQSSNKLDKQMNRTEKDTNKSLPTIETVNDIGHASTSADYTQRIEQILTEPQEIVPPSETKSHNKRDSMSKELVNSNIEESQKTVDLNSVVKVEKLNITEQLNCAVNIQPSEIKPNIDEVQATPSTDKSSTQNDDSNEQTENIIKSESGVSQVAEQHNTNLPEIISKLKLKTEDISNEKQPLNNIKKDVITPKSANVINQKFTLSAATDHNKSKKPVPTCNPDGNRDSTEKNVSNVNNIEAVKETQKCKKSEKVSSPDKVPTTKSENKVTSTKSENKVASTKLENKGVSTKLEEKVPLLLNNPYIRGIEKRMYEYLEEKFIIMTRIHSGHFSSVYKCINEKDKTYALKVFKTGYRSKAIQKDEMLRGLQKIAKKNKYSILEILNSFNSSGEWCFMTEIYPKTLEQALEESKKCFHIDLVQTLARQLVDAVCMLMDNCIVHTDIKPSHILLNSTNDRLKLCGFDRAEQAFNLHNVIIPSTGSVNYRAPEIILGFDTDYTKIDVWSTALVIFEMSAGTKLFPGRFNNDMLFKQQCTLGRIDIDMLENSVNHWMHFSGREFLRQMGPGSWVLTRFYVRNKKLRNLLFNSYNKDWRVSRQNQSVKDLEKLEMLNTLLEHMLMMNPMQRILINYVSSSEFLSESWDYYNDPE